MLCFALQVVQDLLFFIDIRCNYNNNLGQGEKDSQVSNLKGKAGFYYLFLYVHTVQEHKYKYDTRNTKSKRKKSNKNLNAEAFHPISSTKQ